ncbi:hypothetical protein RRG08_032662 [Elysia crispata]|uniref:Uncharacterized protein n=1 Tax=Elysia crispata TaxID=231223 RepID=A0AAE0XZS0_9GAST|nr:hypothetical protein RRG08_032662 [Elysia crispata]
MRYNWWEKWEMEDEQWALEDNFALELINDYRNFNRATDMYDLLYATFIRNSGQVKETKCFRVSRPPRKTKSVRPPPVRIATSLALNGRSEFKKPCNKHTGSKQTLLRRESQKHRGRKN